MEALMCLCCICIILLAFSVSVICFILFDVYRTFKANGYMWRHNIQLVIYGITNQISCLCDEIKLLRTDLKFIAGLDEKDDK